MISKEICEKIWHCHREIECSEKLLADIKETIQKAKCADNPPALKDHFGYRHQTLQLGVPSGESSHRLYALSFALAEPIIRAHIAHKQAELAEMNEMARLELLHD